MVETGGRPAFGMPVRHRDARRPRPVRAGGGAPSAILRAVRVAAGLVDLNVDLGELPSEPDALYRLATVANVACAGHAGDETSMRRAVCAARDAGIRLAAHPSYADRAGFGRTRHASPPAVVREVVEAQCAALAAIARAEGMACAMMKPHGALYHDAAADPAMAAAVIDAARAALGDALVIVGPPVGALAAAAAAAGLAYAREGFADRGYDPSGGLLPRGTPGALLEDPAAAAAQALALAARGDRETICVHGDTPGAVAIAGAVRRALEEAGCLRLPG